jgi:hypothetical protein
VLDGLRQDLVFGLRAMLRTPVVSGAAVLALALGAARAARVQPARALRAG